MPAEITTVTVDGQPIHLVKSEDSWNGALPIANYLEFVSVKPVFRGTKLTSGFRSEDPEKYK